MQVQASNDSHSFNSLSFAVCFSVTVTSHNSEVATIKLNRKKAKISQNKNKMPFVRNNRKIWQKLKIQRWQQKKMSKQFIVSQRKDDFRDLDTFHAAMRPCKTD